MAGINIQDIDAITLGNGILEMGGVNLGQLKDSVELVPKIDWLDFKAGVPRRLVKRFILEEGATIKASMAELSATNFKTLSANATEEIITPGVSAGTPVTLTLTGSTLWTLLGGAVPTSIADAANKPTVKNIGNTVTYVENTDYVVDYVNGAVRRTPTSTITDGQQVNVVYKTNTASAKRYHHGGKTAITNLPMTFTHYKPNGKYIKIFFYQAMLESGFPIKFEEDKVSLQAVTITAIADSTQANGKQLYYVEFEQ